MATAKAAAGVSRRRRWRRLGGDPVREGGAEGTWDMAFSVSRGRSLSRSAHPSDGPRAGGGVTYRRRTGAEHDCSSGATGVRAGRPGPAAMLGGTTSSRRSRTRKVPNR
ncbi:hypothetical protein CCO02nite_27700 [Cellulomonas composti]|uniref:Uncharacterized protein n=1 Tax=Cellulomonas composti TaxID=266130 RepID=A0A511JDR3_9CELL|nr:hypothetical protein CCO02nite_27700 [Cellulomonas composti]